MCTFHDVLLIAIGKGKHSIYSSCALKSNRTKMEGIVIASDLSATISASKPIKKKVPALHEQEDGDSSSVDSNEEGPFSPRDAEVKARKQLRSFLLSKGIEPHLSDDYKVHVKMKKARNSVGGGSGESVGYTVSYSCPLGSIIVSKADVLSSIQESRRRQQNLHHKSNNSSAKRSEAANDSSKRLAALELPVIIDGITVLSFGVVDSRPEFHTAVQMYPLGYKCEQTVQVGSLSKGLLLTTVVCEVDEVDGGPAFRITVKGSAEVYLASTEAQVWKKFNQSVAESDWSLSFFNLEVERLLEGLPGALDLEEYKFHVERGYGSAYFNQADSVAAKQAFLARSGRERRNLDRQRNRFMTREEQEAASEQHKAKLAEEKDLHKRLAAAERLRREREKEESRRAREQRRTEEAQHKERAKTAERARKERSRLNDKARQLKRKEVQAEIKRNRVDAAAAVLLHFDEEEDETTECGAAGGAHGTNAESGRRADGNDDTATIAELLSSLPDAAAELGLAGSAADSAPGGVGAAVATLDDVAKISATLHLFRRELNLDASTASSLDALLSCVQSVSGCPRAPTPAGEKANDCAGTADGEPIATPVNVESDSASVDLSAEKPTDSAVMPADADSVEQGSVDLVQTGVPPLAEEDCDSDSHSGAVFSAEAEMDRVQLSLVQWLLRDLHAALDVQEGGSGSAAEGVRFPLNQLTWPELARMAIVSCALAELGKHKEDIQHALRGAKQPNYRSAKNIVRNVRYRLLARSNLMGRATSPLSAELGTAGCTLGEDKLHAMNRPAEDQRGSGELQRVVVSQNAFNNEQEILAALEALCADPSTYSEAYRRCAKVLLKVMGLSAGRNLVWEVDAELYPDYYDSVRRPVMIANIATALVNRSYSGGGGGHEGASNGDAEYRSVADQFGADLKQVAVNCWTYNSEVTPIVAQAQKLYLATHRCLERWVYAEDRPPVEECDDRRCLLSGEVIATSIPGSLVKCGKCTGCFAYEAVFGSAADSAPFLVVRPAQVVLDQVSDEWVCPFCLREDSPRLHAGEGAAEPVFFVNEWGPSAALPWLLNDRHSSVVSSATSDAPFLQSLLDALKIVCRSSSSHLYVPASGWECTEQQSATDRPAAHWSLADRITVLAGLCHVFRGSDRSVEVLGRVYADCEKLLRISAKVAFREADFMDSVRAVAGEEAVHLCRGLLDGIDGGESSQRVLQNMVVEGRCVVCRGSTFDEDMGRGEDDAPSADTEIVLCDGCNAEVHLKCLNLTAVPSSEWHCGACKERISQRDAKVDHSFDNADRVRSKDVEDELLELAVDKRQVEGESGHGDDADAGVKCRYCGMGELALCSPLVVAQSRVEHDSAVQLGGRSLVSADGFFSGRVGTSVRFMVDGKELAASGLTFPYLPPVDSAAGLQLMAASESVGQPAPVAHEVCALQMFQARVNRSKHNLRRRRKVVGSLAVSLSGISLKPLGHDDSGAEYWKLPTSDALFVCTGGARNSDKEDFLRAIGRDVSPADSDLRDSPRQWKRLSDVEAIRRLTDLLGDSPRERDLRRNIQQSRVLDSVAVAPTAGDCSAVVVAGAVQRENAEACEARDAGEEGHSSYVKKITDAVPAELKLLPNKGQEISSLYVIAEEAAFEQGGGDDSGSGEQDDDAELYFTFSKNRKYYGIALMNAGGSMIRANSRTGLTIVYQIHRVGVASPLTYAPLSEPWTDHMYYFSTVHFRRSGRYTISFIAEGPNAGNIPPLVFPVQVIAQFVRCGVSDALSKLRAAAFVDRAGRQVLHDRRDIMRLIAQVDTEVQAVRSAILTVYAALPAGSLATEDSSVTATAFAPFESVAEPSGWNDLLDQVWRSAVQNAQTPLELMECVLLLEFYLARSWLVAPHNRLLNALPNPHFAVRCATFASVALRIYSLDRALEFERAVAAPRDRRSAGGDSSMAASSSRASLNNEEVYGGRSQRSAAAHASARIRNQQSDDRDRVSEEPYNADNKWHCPSCSLLNEARARSCSTCGERKPSVAALVASARAHSRSGSNGRAKSRASKRRIRSSDEEDEDEESESGSDDDSQSSGQRRRSSGRQRSNVRSYRESASDDEEDGYGAAAPKRARRATPEEEEAAAVSAFYEDYRRRVLPRKMEQMDRRIAQQMALSTQEGVNASAVELNARLLSVLRRVLTNIRSQPFWEPVDTKAVPSYRRYVQHPMDLGTIAERVSSGYYALATRPTDAFLEDVRLVWSNCRAFNQESSPLYQDATILDREFQELFEAWVLAAGRPENPDIPPRDEDSGGVDEEEEDAGEYASVADNVSDEEEEEDDDEEEEEEMQF